MITRKIVSILPIESIILSEDTENDDYPMEYPNTNTVAEDMLRWVTLNQNAQNR